MWVLILITYYAIDDGGIEITGIQTETKSECVAAKEAVIKKLVRKKLKGTIMCTTEE